MYKTNPFLRTVLAFFMLFAFALLLVLMPVLFVHAQYDAHGHMTQCPFMQHVEGVCGMSGFSHLSAMKALATAVFLSIVLAVACIATGTVFLQTHARLRRTHVTYRACISPHLFLFGTTISPRAP